MNNVVQFRDDDDAFKRIESPVDGPVLGQWYWYTPDQDFDAVKEAKLHPDERQRRAENRVPWLGCAMQIGSNFVELESPHGDRSYHSARVHLSEFWTRLRHEPDADAVIRRNIGNAQHESQRLLGEVKELTMRLGMGGVQQQSGTGSDNGSALMVLSATHDVKAYGRDLALAKDEQLPALFKAVKEANEELALWMKAPSMPMLAQLHAMKESVSDIDDRIFSVSLYAGLTEDAVQCAEGAPAQPLDRLHVMQRMAFMDEECLANYRTGGMEFKNIGEFDLFMADPVNRDRILPFPRCLVAMRVRREKKERDSYGSISQAMVNMRLEQADKFTFLYIRNGEQVWRISCEMDFGTLIFPDKSVYNPLEPKMVKMRGGRVDRFMAVTEWEVLRDKHRAGIKQYNAWAKLNPGNTWINNPHREFGWSGDFHESDWSPMDHSNVYFDEAMAEIGKKIKEYNRVALIIQGLFDRSLVLHPHPPVQTWSADGFDKAVKLVYDGSDTIAYGNPPDFEAYRARCNASLAVGSMAVGQQHYWTLKEGNKESKRRDNDWRNKSDYRPQHFEPYGNPGPGYVARVVRVSKTKGATFEWERRKQTGNYGELIKCTLTVPLSAIFNVAAYTPGDYKQFFADSRTRMHYLKWAPLLIAAEEYHATGKTQ